MDFIRSRRSLLAFLLALSLPFVLAACGSDDGGDDAADTQAQETPAEEETTPADDSGEAQFVHVVATEYQFTGIPESLSAGSYEFHLQNDGKEPHELLLFGLKTDTPIEELIKLPQKEAEKQIEMVGATFAEPGAASEETVKADLEAGRYGVVCFVPVGGKKGPPHAFEGMVHEFTVE